MKTLSIKRIAATVAAAAAVLVPMLFGPANAPGQGNANASPIAGTWSSAINDGHGGVNHTWYTFGADGAYRMVSFIQGGQNAGNEIQRWGQYRWQSTGQNQGVAQVHVVGGAPQQICTQGSGCTAVQNLQGNMSWQLQVQGNQLRNGNAVFQRSQVPQQLTAQVPATRTIQGPVATQGGRYVSPRNSNGEVTNTPGLGRNCDDAQQANVCHYGNGGNLIRNNATGCMVCQQY